MNSSISADLFTGAGAEEGTRSIASVLASALVPSLRFREDLWLGEVGPSVPMIQALVAPGPLPEFAHKLSLFGQFVGSWDLDLVNYPDGTEPVRRTGEWHFGWALEGRAILDVWISPRREERSSIVDPHGDYGATIRFYDLELDAWRSTWIGPCKGVVRPFIARKEGDEIVLSGSFKTGSEVRWIFSEIGPSHFHWRSLESVDGWKTHRLWQEMYASRRMAA